MTAIASFSRAALSDDIPRCGNEPRPLPHGLLDKLGLNPQPLPPKAAFDDFCGTVPRGPFPPVPPHIGAIAGIAGLMR